MERLEAGDRTIFGAEVPAESDIAVVAASPESLQVRVLLTMGTAVSIKRCGRGGRTGVLLSRSRLSRLFIRWSGTSLLYSEELSVGSFNSVSSGAWMGIGLRGI